jgi:hypothetical protein
LLCFALLCFVLFCFVLFCFVLFCLFTLLSSFRLMVSPTQIAEFYDEATIAFVNIANFDELERQEYHIFYSILFPSFSIRTEVGSK